MVDAAPYPEFAVQSWRDYAAKCARHGCLLPMRCPTCGGDYGLEITLKLDPPRVAAARQPVVGVGCSEGCAHVNAVQRKLARAERAQKRSEDRRRRFKRAVIIENGP